MSDDAVNTPTPEPSFEELRAMLSDEGSEPTEDKPAAEVPAAEKTSEAAPAAEIPAPESETGDPEEHELETKKGLKKRFKDLTSKIRELEAQLHTTGKPAVAESAESKPGVASPAAAAEPQGKPKAEEFDTYDAYIEKLTDWTIAAREQSTRALEAQRTAAAAWDSKVAEATAKHPDFADVVGAAALPVTPAIVEAIKTSDAGAELAYHLAMNPEECKRIAGLTPVAAVRELGKLEGKLTTPPTPKPAVKETLPKPPAVVGGGGSPAEVDLDNCDMRTFTREMKKIL